MGWLVTVPSLTGSGSLYFRDEEKAFTQTRVAAYLIKPSDLNFSLN